MYIYLSTFWIMGCRRCRRWMCDRMTKKETTYIVVRSCMPYRALWKMEMTWFALASIWWSCICDLALNAFMGQQQHPVCETCALKAAIRAIWFTYFESSSSCSFALWIKWLSRQLDVGVAIAYMCDVRNLERKVNQHKAHILSVDCDELKCFLCRRSFIWH